MRRYSRFALLMLLLFAAMILSPRVPAAESAKSAGETPIERGYRLLLTKPYLTPDFDQETFDELWKVWEAPLQAKAEKATPAERRKMAYSRYGLVERPDDPKHRPMQYVVDDRGNWTMNCL